jgi:hypothetical protein
MVPFSAFSTSRWEYGSPRLERYNGLPYVLRQHTVFRFGHDVHFLHAAAVDKVVDIASAPGSVLTVWKIHRSSKSISIRKKPRRWASPSATLTPRWATHAGQHVRMLRHHAKQLITCLGQFFVSQAALINQVDIDQEKAQALGVSISDINTTLGAAWGGSYVND